MNSVKIGLSLFFLICISFCKPIDGKKNHSTKAIINSYSQLRDAYTCEYKYKGAYYQIEYDFIDTTYTCYFKFEGEKVSTCKGNYKIVDTFLFKTNRVFTFERIEEPQPPQTLPNMKQALRALKDTSFDMYLPKESEEGIDGVWITLSKVKK